MPVLLGMTGLAIDMGNIYLAHSRLQTAVDAAALAGSLQLPYDPDMTEGLVSSAATEMVADNLPTAEVMSVSPGTDVRSVCVEAQVEVDMMLMGALGIQSKYIDASACAGFNNMEIVFVVDNSGSMAGSPINAVNQAASALVDLIMPDGTEASVKGWTGSLRGQGENRPWGRRPARRLQERRRLTGRGTEAGIHASHLPEPPLVSSSCLLQHLFGHSPGVGFEHR